MDTLLWKEETGKLVIPVLDLLNSVVLTLEEIRFAGVQVGRRRTRHTARPRRRGSLPDAFPAPGAVHAAGGGVAAGGGAVRAQEAQEDPEARHHLPQPQHVDERAPRQQPAAGLGLLADRLPKDPHAGLLAGAGPQAALRVPPGGLLLGEGAADQRQRQHHRHRQVHPHDLPLHPLGRLHLLLPQHRVEVRSGRRVGDLGRPDGGEHAPPHRVLREHRRGELSPVHLPRAQRSHQLRLRAYRPKADGRAGAVHRHHSDPGRDPSVHSR
uniref:Uncharacterized protein n=1 Tax=Tetraselmis sp. GSL018 TaxID=582737 RepID=A0A061SJ58_9CHLO